MIQRTRKASRRMNYIGASDFEVLPYCIAFVFRHNKIVPPRLSLSSPFHLPSIFESSSSHLRTLGHLYPRLPLPTPFLPPCNTNWARHIATLSTPYPHDSPTIFHHIINTKRERTKFRYSELGTEIQKICISDI